MKLDNIFTVIGRNFKLVYSIETIKSLVIFTVIAILVHIPLIVLLGASTFVGMSAVPVLPTAPESVSIVIAVLTAIVAIVYAGYDASIQALFSLKISNKLDISVPEIFKSAFPRMLDMLVLAFVGSFVLMLGFLALVIPGIILLVTFGFAPFILVEEKIGAFKAFKRSAEMTKGNRLMIFVWLLIFFLINAFVPALLSEVHELLGGITGVILGLLQIFVTVDYYYQLKGGTPSVGSNEQTPTQPEQMEPSPAQIMNEEQAPQMMENLPDAPQQQEATQNLA